jgi:hypothetical protein
VLSATLTIIGLTVAAATVAMAGRSPLSSSAPVNAASARAPVTALFLLLVGAGVVAVTALVVLLWPRRASDEPGFTPEPPKVHWIWKLVAASLPLALGAAAIVAAILGSKRVRNPPRLALSPRTGFGTHREVSTAPRTGFVLPAWLPWTVIAILVAAVVVAVLVLVARRNSVADEPAERDAAQAALGAAMQALDTEDDPRTAVIAAYVAMEGAFAAHGLARSSTEAPREYLTRVLSLSGGAGGEATTLTNLFEEARFSRHPISERVRERALGALRTLRARLSGGGA